jgi:hypothetical protein
MSEITNDQVERLSVAGAAVLAEVLRTWAVKRALQRWVDPKAGWKDAYILSMVFSAIGAWVNQGARNDNKVAERLAVEPKDSVVDFLKQFDGF